MINSMSVKELKQKMTTEEGLTLIDCREQKEWDQGHIPGAIHIPLSSFDQGVQVLNEKSNPVVIHCRGGKRSMKACKLLQAKGFQQLYNLDGGIIAWEKIGEAVENSPS